MVVISPFVKPIGTATAVIGLIQGVVWTVMSLMAALIYLKAWTPDLSSETYGQSLSLLIVTKYLFADLPKNSLYYIQPLTFFIWNILYFIVSIIWICISSYQLWAVTQHEHRFVKKTFLAWGTWTSIICVCDLVLASLLASDYNTTVGLYNKTPVLGAEYAILAIGVVMTLAARGFVLWLVNLTFAVILIQISNGFPNKVPERGNTIDRFGETTPGAHSYTNSGFAWDTNKPNFTRSDSFITAQSPQAAENLARLPPIVPTNERLAKIGRQGPKSPPQHVRPPKLPQSYIYPTQPRVPSPDYSPPNSPLPQPPPKPSIKNRNQNAYGFKY